MNTAATIANTTRDKVSTHTLLAALVLGIAGDILFMDIGPFGTRLSIWVALLGVAAFMLNRNADFEWRKTLFLWSSTALAATLVLVFRAADDLIGPTLIVLVLCSSSVLLQAKGTPLRAARVADYFHSGFQMPVQVLLGIIPLLGKIPLRDASMSARTIGIVRGLLIVTPLLLVFVGLFSSADSTFERYASSFGDMLSLDTPRHILVVLVISWIATGLLTCTFRQESSAGSSQDSSRAGLAPARDSVRFLRSLGDEEVGVIMGSLVALFLVFVILQASYLFGGSEMIERTSGLTVAGYARRGFFELLAVSVLTLAVLLLISATQCNQRIFRPLALVLVTCVLMILVSAAQRLSLYTDAFGLTMSRVIAVAFMVWLACNLVSFTFTVLRGRSQGFASGLVVSGIAAIILLGTANPAAVVARMNLDRAIEGGQEIDMMYLSSLGADAAPATLERLHELPAREQCVAAHNLLNSFGSADPKWRDDWRLWNASEAAAHRAVTARHDELTALIQAGPRR